MLRIENPYRDKRVLSIDIETYSETNLKTCGLYAYADDPSFEVLIFAYAVDDGPVRSIDLAQGGELPSQLVHALFDPDYIKSAQNAAFEIYCLSKYLGKQLPIKQWIDTMIIAAVLGYPLSLDQLGKAINGHGEQKDTKGKNLIKYFSVPCKPTKVNGGRTRNYPHHDPERWAEYKSYCRQDVVTERAAREFMVSRYGIDWRVMAEWWIDLRINQRGAMINRSYVKGVINFYDRFKMKIMERQKKITGVSNPNSVPQLLGWLNDRGVNMPNMQAETIENHRKILQAEGMDLEDEVLQNRQFLSKSSISKYERMVHYTNNNRKCRARGLFQFYGGHTGRWAGRGIQLQNLPKMHYSMDELNELVYIVQHQDFEFIELIVDSIPDTISALTRTAIVAPKGRLLFVSDLNSIEARVSAWLAGVKWRLDVFKTTGKIYESSASMMFGVPVEEITKDSPLRQQGKVAELALGYGGGAGAMAQMDFGGKVRPDLSDGAKREYAEENNLDPDDPIDWASLEELMIADNYDRLKRLWREASPEIPAMWKTLEKAAIRAYKKRVRVNLVKGIYFEIRRGTLFIGLPSGRELAYPEIYLKTKLVKPKGNQKFEPFESDDILYKTLTAGHWRSESTYGGKLFENIVQAIARDILMDAIRYIELSDVPFQVVGHVHDEVITEAPIDADLEELNDILRRPVKWADEDLVLDAAGFKSPFYLKD